MADRLTKIVTRGGDSGETSLGDGTRVSKTDPRIGLLGDVDELNSTIGVVLEHIATEEIRNTLEGVQHDLFDLGGGLCFPGAPLLSDAHLGRLDDAAQRLNSELPPLKDFILPGGSPALAFIHVARTVCRRVERSMADFAQVHDEAQPALKYLNRLSDYLFIAARFEAKTQNIAEVLWEKNKSLSS